jgi:hypothetical protein
MATPPGWQFTVQYAVTMAWLAYMATLLALWPQ